MPDPVGPPTVERFRRWGIIAWSTIGLLILTGVVFWALGQVTEIFPPLFVALITIYLLNPLVTRLEGRGLSRVFGSCLTYVLLIAIVVTALILLIPVLVHQGAAFAQDLPKAVDRFGGYAHRASIEIERRIGGNFQLSEWVGSRSDLVSEGLNRVGGLLKSAAQALTLIVIGLVIGFYLLVDLPRLRRGAVHMIPPDRRDEVRKIANAVAAAMGAFFRGQLLVAFVVGVMSAIGMWAIGLPSWGIVGAIAGFFNLVPLIGPFIGAVPAILIAATLDAPIKILLVIVILTVVQQIDNHFISPNVMGWSVKLHAVTVMLSLTAGAALAGLFGMLVAVPIVASLKIVFAHIWRTRVPWGEEVFKFEERLEGRAVERGPPHLTGASKHEQRPAVLPQETGQPPTDPGGSGAPGDGGPLPV
jgi:predicted PurR-regulated permease PerM